MNELLEKVQQLCDDIQELHFVEFPNLTHDSWSYEVGRKYIKVIHNGQWQRSVWGFINIGNSDFAFGDVLKADGWKKPTLNKARGNLLDGYKVFGMRKYGPDYLI